MEHKEVTTWVLASIFVIFLLFSLYRPDLNLKDISGKITNEPNPSSTNLVLRFDFEEGSGTTASDWATSLGGANNGQLFNNPSWITTGKYDKALSFDGSNDYIEVSDNANLKGGQDWTITAWVKPELNEKTILNKGGDYQIEILSNGVVKCSYIKNGVNGVSSTNNINLNSWNFVACSYQRTTNTLSIYLNGVKNQATPTQDNEGKTSALTIGNGISYFKGSIDSVRFYNAVLSDTDISTIYNFAYCGNGIKEGSESCDGTDKGTSTCGTQGFTGGTLNCNSGCTFDTSACTNTPAGELILEYKFDENTGQSIADSSTKNFNGQLGSTASADNNDPIWTSGRSGTALNFDGFNDYATVNDNDLFSPSVNSLSVAFWAKVPTTATVVGEGARANTGAYFIGKGGGSNFEWAIENDKNNLLAATIWNLGGGDWLGCQYSTTINDGNWHHYVLVVSNSAGTVNSLKLYKDGASVCTDTTVGSIATGNGVAKISLGQRGDGNYFNGILDDLKIYNKILIDSEILTLYNTTPTSPPTISLPILDLTNISNKIMLNSNIIGNVKFTSASLISNNTVIELNLSKTGKSFTENLSLQEIMTILDIQGTQVGNGITYPAGTYSVESSKFNVISNIAGDYTLTAVLTTPENNKDTKTKSISVEYTQGSITLYNVSFSTLFNSFTFSKGNTLNCSAYVYDEKGIGGFNYKIFGPNKSASDADYSNSLSCSGLGYKYCSAEINTTIARKGNWTCVFNVINASNSYSFASLKNLTMINSGPILKSNIPNKTWGGGILNNAIDLKNYFEDFDGDNLIFTSTGNVSPIKMNISAFGIVNLNATNFVGSKNVYFSASDGISSVNSNTILLKVTGNITGNATTVCIPDWDIGNFSDCMSDNKQFRIITDSNGCNNETGKPLDEQNCTYQPTTNTNLQTQQPASQAQQGIQKSIEEEGLTKEQKLLYSGILLGFFVLLTVVIVLISKFKGRKPVVQTNLKPKAEVKSSVTPVKKFETVKVRVKETIQPANLEAMRDYSVKMIMRGAESFKVKEALEKAGWPKEGIEDAVNYAVLYNFAKKKLNEGMSKEKIKSMLIAKKWSIDLINEIISRL